jgi:hypothetical protein
MPGITGEDLTPGLALAQVKRAWELHEAGMVRELPPDGRVERGARARM